MKKRIWNTVCQKNYAIGIQSKDSRSIPIEREAIQKNNKSMVQKILFITIDIVNCKIW